jgi:PAS domain S-box-containing protein
MAIAKIAILKRKLLEQHALLRALTDFGQEFLYLRNPQGQFQYVSPYCQELTGYTPEEFYQNPQQMDALIYGEDLPIWNQHVEHMFNSCGESESLVLRIVTKSGSVRWINHVCSSVFDYEGRFQGVRSTNIDITQHEELERLKEQFLRRMSHEFRTPMNGILGCTDLINSELPDNSDLKKYLEIIQSSSERLMQTLDNIMELTRLSNTQTGIYSTHKPFDLLAMVQRLINLYQLRARIEGKKLQLIFTHHPENIEIFLPADVIECILKNLLDNAVKFSHSGQISVNLYLNQDIIDIYVTDKGIGIKPEFLPLIFDEFTQGSEGDSRHFDGTGIGLTVVKKLLDSLHGSIQVTSEPKQGTTVAIQLPFNPKK